MTLICIYSTVVEIEGKIYNEINKNTRIHSVMGFDYHYYVGNNDFLKYFHFFSFHGGQGKKHLFSNCF